MLTALQLEISSEQDKARAIVFKIDDVTDEELLDLGRGSAIVENIFEVEGTSPESILILFGIVKSFHPECYAVRVEKGTKGAVKAGNHFCIKTNTTRAFRKAARENINRIGD